MWSLIAVAVFALLGLLRGAARQLASIAALLCASIASGPLSQALGPWWASKQPALSLPAAVALSFVISFILLCLFVYVLVFLSLRPQHREHDEQGPPPSRLSPLGNRSLGFCLGAFKGAFLVWLLLSLTLLLTQKLSWLPFSLPWEFEGSRACAFVKKYNALNQAHWEKLLALEKMAKLFPYVSQWLPGQKLDPQPLSQELDKLKQLFDNPEIKRAFEKKQFNKLLKNEELDKLLSSASFLKALEDFRHFSKLTTSQEGPPPPPPP